MHWDNMWKYGLRTVLVLYVLLMKYIPSTILSYTRELWVRIIFGLAVIYLAYCDILSAMLLAVAFFLSSQDYENRAALTKLAKPVKHSAAAYMGGSRPMPTWLEDMGPDADHKAYVVDEVEPGTEYARTNMDQQKDPASMTLSENIRFGAGGFITGQNLLDAQINSAQGASINDKVCGNTGSGPAPLDEEACAFSRYA
jgi:hypothetical protein